MNNFYKGGRGLAFSQREEGASSRKEKPPRLSKILINQVEEEGTEGSPNNTRRNRWIFYLFFDVFKARIKYRCSKDVVPFTQRLRKITEVPFMYRECTVSVRGVYRKGTGDLLRSYWRSTTDLLNACTSGVDQRYSKSRRIVGVEAMTNKVTLCLTGLLCFMLFNLSTAWAQSAESRAAEGQIEIKPLQIGDAIPEELWHLPLQVVNHPEGKDTVTLNDYRDKKLIILDFMHTRCKGCTDKLTELDTLQNTFGCIIQFVLMSPEKKSEMESFLKYRPMSTFYNFPLTFIDQTVADYFRYRFISHFVWVYRGKIVAITGGNDVADDNIKKLLNTGNINLPVKNDFEEEEDV